MRPVHMLSYIYIYITLIRSHGWVRTSIICIRPYFHLPYNFSFHKDVQIFTPQWGHCSDFSHFWGNVSWFFCLQYFEKLYMVHWYMDRHLQNIPTWLFFVTRVPPYSIPNSMHKFLLLFNLWVYYLESRSKIYHLSMHLYTHRLYYRA